MPFSIRTLAMTLAHATPEQQRALLGENLYPLVEKIEPRAAPKVTGMLLELDRTEVLNLIQSPSALKSKVHEAMEVLRSAAHPSNLRALLGGSLYPLVEELEPHTAPKVTGMLLELDPTEVFNLIQSPSALKSKVYEAMQVLRTVAHPSLRNKKVDDGRMPRRGASTCYRQPPAQIRGLAAALEHATPEEEVALLGSNLYPLVHKLVPIKAAKVTEMLIELGKTEVLHLIRSPKALKSKVGEAMQVLTNCAGC